LTFWCAELASVSKKNIDFIVQHNSKYLIPNSRRLLPLFEPGGEIHTEGFGRAAGGLGVCCAAMEETKAGAWRR